MNYSLGIDLGTTTVAAVIVDEKGRAYPVKTVLNFQYPGCGIDSIKRIQNGLDEDSSANLRDKAVSTVNYLIGEYKKELGFDYKDVREVVVAGNTAMEMAFCGYPLMSLSKPPYRPSSEIYFPDNTDFFPGFSLINKKLFIFPVLDGFVGGDAVASIFYLDMAKSEKPVFLADFGTNVEIAVGCREKIFTTSAPAGPAFEGGNIKYGMTASRGAISDVSLENGTFKIKTIGGGHPEGICGSGITSIVYELLKEGVLDKNGRILPPELIESESFPVARKGEKENEVLVYSDGRSAIKFSQDDVRQFQFAKSAVKTASEILLEKFKISGYGDFDVYISGTFGSHIKPDIIDLIDIFPFKGKNINFIEGSVVMGCKKYILADGRRREDGIKEIMERAKNFPLSGSRLFERRFIGNVSF